MIMLPLYMHTQMCACCDRLFIILRNDLQFAWRIDIYPTKIKVTVDFVNYKFAGIIAGNMLIHLGIALFIDFWSG